MNVINTNEKINSLKLERLYLDYRSLMYKEAKKILHNQYDAEDAVQSAFVKLTNCADRITDEMPAMTYNFMKVVARNVALDIHKKKLYLNKYENTYENVEQELADVNQELSDIVIDKCSVERIIEQIKKLPDNYRDLIILEKVYGYTREETMALFGVNYETVKKRMTRAKTKLLEALKKEDLNDGRTTIRPKS